MCCVKVLNSYVKKNNKSNKLHYSYPFSYQLIHWRMTKEDFWQDLWRFFSPQLWVASSLSIEAWKLTRLQERQLWWCDTFCEKSILLEASNIASKTHWESLIKFTSHLISCDQQLGLLTLRLTSWCSQSGYQIGPKHGWRMLSVKATGLVHSDYPTQVIQFHGSTLLLNAQMCHNMADPFYVISLVVIAVTVKLYWFCQGYLEFIFRFAMKVLSTDQFHVQLYNSLCSFVFLELHIILKLRLACTDEVHSFTASYEYVHATEEVPHISAYKCWVD